MGVLSHHFHQYNTDVYKRQAVGVDVGAVLGLFVFGAVVTAGAFVTAGFFALTVTLQVSFFFPTFANTTALPAFLPFTTTLVFFFFERLTTCLLYTSLLLPRGFMILKSWIRLLRLF